MTPPDSLSNGGLGAPARKLLRAGILGRSSTAAAMPEPALLAVRLTAASMLIMTLKAGSVFVAAPGALQAPMRTALYGVLLLLVAGWSPRIGCLLAGLMLVIGAGSLQQAGVLWCGFMLLVAGLCHRQAGARPLQWLAAAAFAIAGWTTFWGLGESARPPLRLAVLLCSQSVAAMLLFPRCHLAGVWGAALLCSAQVVLLGRPFSLLELGLLAALPAFLRFPETPFEVIYDGECGLCDWWRRALSRLDSSRVFHWRSLHSERARALPISASQAAARIHLIAGREVHAGFQAVRRILVYLPAFWIAIFAALALAPSGAACSWLIAALMVWFSPLMHPIGEAAYDWIARNRGRLGRVRACVLKP